MCVKDSQLIRCLPVRASGRKTSAGLEHRCCLTSHDEYSEAAVTEGSGGKNSKVIEANPT